MSVAEWAEMFAWMERLRSPWRGLSNDTTESHSNTRLSYRNEQSKKCLK